MRHSLKSIIIIMVVAVFLSPVLVFAGPQVNKYIHSSIESIEKMKPNGEYEIYISKGGEWQRLGSLTFDQYFRERKIDLIGYIPANEKVSVRLIQKGGGAAHIDSVLLGGMPAIEVKGVQNALKKLSSKDFDVIDAFKKEIIVVFPVNVKGQQLDITARVEKTEISKTPFQFPSDNLFKKIGTSSKFYTYNMISGDTASPFFEEYSHAGSGHPSGLTYGWVRHDDNNLYVKIDFTPDNTMDGTKDYAKVYAKTEKGVKEFKVSVSDTKWGKADFSYTDKVPYEHKVYDFRIPLKELEISNVKKGKELQLAFATYGTASPTLICPDPTTAPPTGYYCNGYEATCVGTEGVDIIETTKGNDVVVALGGNDDVYGNSGSDIICGGKGDDYIYGGPDEDWLSGGPGNDYLYGEDDDDILDGNDGNDHLYGQDGEDVLSGNNGHDYLSGGPGDDILYGNNGMDTLYGFDGNDELYGGNNYDHLYGGDGTDLCKPGKGGYSSTGCELW